MRALSRGRVAAILLVCGAAAGGGLLVTAPRSAPPVVTAPQSAPPVVTAPDGTGIVSLPLRAVAPAAAPTTVGEPEEERERLPIRGTPGTAPGIQRTTKAPGAVTDAAMPVADASFDGIGEGMSGFAIHAIPPDPSIAVGSTQVVEVVNSSIAVFSRTGSRLLGPVATNTLFSGVAGDRCATTNDGDGVVAYDRAAGRWVVTWFAINGADGFAVPYRECVAVSTSSDATGSWARYSFAYSTFDDYPKLAIWRDSYVVTFNMFDGSLNWVGGEVCAYDRTSMLAGTAARAQQCFDAGSWYGGLLAADTDSATPPPAGAPVPVLALDTYSSLAAFRLNVDWSNPAASSLDGPDIVAVPSFDLPCTWGAECAGQPGTARQLDSLGDRLMNRLAYRNDGGTERLAVAQSVDDGTGNGSAVRWYQLGIAADRSVALADTGTYAPTGTVSRWMPSAALDRSGNLAIGYSLSGPTVYPSLAWAGRLAGDPAGTLGQAEAIVVAGTGSQNGQYTRWGDYSALVLDPLDQCTFWYVGEYVKTSGEATWRTRIASFAYPSCEGAAPRAVVSSPATPTTSADLAFGVVFSKPLSGLAAGAMATEGSATGCVIGTPSGAATTWSVPVTGCSDGTVRLRLPSGSISDSTGNAGPPLDVTSALVLIDRTAPVVTGLPVATIRSGTALANASSTPAVPVTLTWTGTDGNRGSGIASWAVASSPDGGLTWTPISGVLTGKPIATVAPSTGTVLFRAVPTDLAGLTGDPAACTGSPQTVRVVQQGSATLRYAGTWRTVLSASRSGGSARYTIKAGASVTTTFTGTSFALLATMGRTSGRARVYVDGVPVVIDLYRSATQLRSVAWARSWAVSGTHTIRIVALGTTGRPRVELDGVIVAR
ncbi:MAG: hypothetical protein WCK58_10110 [Chloroflexota bacterium]